MDMRDVLPVLERNPLPYCTLRKRLCSDEARADENRLRSVLGKACESGDLFFCYDVVSMVEDRVRGTIIWTCDQSGDVAQLIKSTRFTPRERVCSLLAQRSPEQEDHLRRKLRHLVTDVASFGEWEYRVYARTKDLDLVRTVYAHLFHEDGSADIYPSDGSTWFSRRMLSMPGRWPPTDPKEERALLDQMRNMRQTIESSKRGRKGQAGYPFAHYMLVGRSGIRLRFYHVESLEILSLQAANLARCENEENRIEAVSKLKDLDAALAPWLQPAAPDTC